MSAGGDLLVGRPSELARLSNWFGGDSTRCPCASDWWPVRLWSETPDVSTKEGPTMTAKNPAATAVAEALREGLAKARSLGRSSVVAEHLRVDQLEALIEATLVHLLSLIHI